MIDCTPVITPSKIQVKSVMDCLKSRRRFLSSAIFTNIVCLPI